MTKIKWILKHYYLTEKIKELTFCNQRILFKQIIENWKISYRDKNPQELIDIFNTQEVKLKPVKILYQNNNLKIVSSSSLIDKNLAEILAGRNIGTFYSTYKSVEFILKENKVVGIVSIYQNKIYEISWLGDWGFNKEKELLSILKHFGYNKQFVNFFNQTLVRIPKEICNVIKKYNLPIEVVNLQNEYFIEKDVNIRSSVKMNVQDMNLLSSYVDSNSSLFVNALTKLSKQDKSSVHPKIIRHSLKNKNFFLINQETLEFLKEYCGSYQIRVWQDQFFVSSKELNLKKPFKSKSIQIFNSLSCHFNCPEIINEFLQNGIHPTKLLSNYKILEANNLQLNIDKTLEYFTKSQIDTSLFSSSIKGCQYKNEEVLNLAIRSQNPSVVEYVIKKYPVKDSMIIEILGNLPVINCLIQDPISYLDECVCTYSFYKNIDKLTKEVLETYKDMPQRINNFIELIVLDSLVKYKLKIESL